MDQTPRVIKISEYSLDSFAVFDSDFYDITLLPLAATKNIVLQCDTSRDFTLDDMAQIQTLDTGKSLFFDHHDGEVTKMFMGWRGLV